MPNSKAQKRLEAASLIEHAKAAAARGDFAYAIAAYERAHKLEPAAGLLVGLADAQWRYGLKDEAAISLTEALKLAPGESYAAWELSSLLEIHRVSTPDKLNHHGLLAAFQHEGVDREPLGRAAMDYLAAAPLREALAASSDDPRGAARSLVLKRTAKALTHPLLHAALFATVNRRADVERLLTNVRRALLLDLPPERFEDKDLVEFTLALIQQCWNNNHVFAAAADEKEAASALAKTAPKDMAGQIRQLALRLLYTPYAEVQELRSEEHLAGVRPKRLSQMLMMRLYEDEALSETAANIPTIITKDLLGETTAAVARHYEANPYPRWLSFQMPKIGSARPLLDRVFGAPRTKFMDKPFDVLVAGAGTGQHAISSALRYGPGARVLAIDLSRASLAYGMLQAKAMGIDNIEFLQADILALDGLEKQFGIIESVGVLHHMEDPFAGWQALLRKLRPGGFMWIGLYSALARENIRELRSDPAFPGASVDDDEARAYRATLLDRGGAPIELLKTSDDFYTLNDFRDLVLNAHEVPLTIPEIAAFLQKTGLVFSGFMPFETRWQLYTSKFPEDKWPGTLDRWAGLEQENPRLFDAMYQFWCRLPE